MKKKLGDWAACFVQVHLCYMITFYRAVVFLLEYSILKFDPICFHTEDLQDLPKNGMNPSVGQCPRIFLTVAEKGLIKPLSSLRVLETNKQRHVLTAWKSFQDISWELKRQGELIFFCHGDTEIKMRPIRPCFKKPWFFSWVVVLVLCLFVCSFVCLFLCGFGGGFVLVFVCFCCFLGGMCGYLFDFFGGFLVFFKCFSFFWILGVLAVNMGVQSLTWWDIGLGSGFCGLTDWAA